MSSSSSSSGAPMRNHNLLYTSDMRQLGGILFILGFCAMVFPVKDSVLGITAFGPNGTADAKDDQLTLWLMIGDLSVLALGLIAMCLGYLLVVRDYGSPTLTLFALIWEQTAFIEWITGMVGLGKSMAPGFGTGNVNFYFTTGLLTMFFLCFLLYGSLGLILFTIYDYQIKDPPTKDAGYYRSRLIFYSFLYLGVGICRFLLPGLKTFQEFGTAGPLDKPFPVVGGPIVFPAMEIAMGCSCSFLGLWGLLKGCGMEFFGGGGSTFGNLVGFNYLAYVVLKVLVEVGFYAPAGAVASAAMISVVFLPAHIILAFLDDKARLGPEQIGPDYYTREDGNGDREASKPMMSYHDEEQPQEQSRQVSDDEEEEDHSE